MVWVPGSLSSCVLGTQAGASHGQGPAHQRRLGPCRAQQRPRAAPPSLSRRIPVGRGGGRAGEGVRAWDPPC